MTITATRTDEVTGTTKAVGRIPGLVPAAVFLAALAGSLVLYHDLWAHPSTTTVGSPHYINDQMQSMWFLKYVPWRLFHGHDPFRTTAINYPEGINLAWNTSTPTLGLAAAPITFIAGAAFSYNMLITLAPALTTLTGFLWLRRHVSFWPAAAVGGLVIGFSSFESGHLKGHLHLAFVALVPLMLLFFEDVLWRRPRPQWRSAVYLGIVTAAQLGISEEIAVIAVAAVILAMLAYLLVDARGLLQASREALVPMALAVGVVLVCASPLLILQFFSGDNFALHNGVWRAHLDEYLWPSGNEAWLLFRNPHAKVGGSEDAVFIGWFMLVVLAIGVVIRWRDRRVHTAVLTAAVLALFTAGPLHVHGIPLPWVVLQRLPSVDAVLPIRFAFGWWLVLAWLVAHFIDLLVGYLRSAQNRTRVVSAVGLAVMAVGLVTWMPRWIPAAPLPRLPHYLAKSHPELPTGSLILLMPATTPNDSGGMYLQQEADFWFLMPMGYAYRPNGLGGGTLWSPQTAVVQMAEKPTRTDAYGLSVARAELVRLPYRAIVVVDGQAQSKHCRELAERLTGRPADLITPGASIWFLQR